MVNLAILDRVSSTETYLIILARLPPINSLSCVDHLISHFISVNNKLMTEVGLNIEGH